MRTHYVIGCPRFAEKDLRWIEAQREKYDPQGKRMAPPHITFAPAIEGMTDQAVVDEVKARVAGLGPVEFELCHVSMSYNPFLDIYQEYLVPETGHAALSKLHNRLYVGAFAPQLRLDIGYVPHISIGRCDHPHIGKQRMDALNRGDFAIKGRIDALDVMSFEDGRMQRIETIPLEAS